MNNKRHAMAGATSATSAAAMLYWEIYNKDGLHKPRVVLTIHNMVS